VLEIDSAISITGLRHQARESGATWALVDAPPTPVVLNTTVCSRCPNRFESPSATPRAIYRSSTFGCIVICYGDICRGAADDGPMTVIQHRLGAPLLRHVGPTKWRRPRSVPPSRSEDQRSTTSVSDIRCQIIGRAGRSTGEDRGFLSVVRDRGRLKRPEQADHAHLLCRDCVSIVSNRLMRPSSVHQTR
jgi:hypothetical protein